MRYGKGRNLCGPEWPQGFAALLQGASRCDDVIYQNQMPAREHFFYHATTDGKGTFEVILPVIFVTVSLWPGCSDTFENRTESATGRHREFFSQQFRLIEAAFEQSIRMHRHRNQNIISADQTFQSAPLLALLRQNHQQLQRRPVFNDANDVAHQTVVTAQGVNRKAAENIFDAPRRIYQTLKFYQTAIAEHHPEISRFAAGMTPERQKNRDKALQNILQPDNPLNSDEFRQFFLSDYGVFSGSPAAIIPLQNQQSLKMQKCSK